MKAIEELLSALQAIAEGYNVEGIADEMIFVENPNYRPDDGSNPLLGIDVVAVRRLVRRCSTPVDGGLASEEKAP